ncbi:hypothetical protein LXL04_019306 [Taraxacum kok-saghyz]
MAAGFWVLGFLGGVRRQEGEVVKGLGALHAPASKFTKTPPQNSRIRIRKNGALHTAATTSSQLRQSDRGGFPYDILKEEKKEEREKNARSLASCERRKRTPKPTGTVCVFSERRFHPPPQLRSPQRLPTPGSLIQFEHLPHSLSKCKSVGQVLKIPQDQICKNNYRLKNIDSWSMIRYMDSNRIPLPPIQPSRTERLRAEPGDHRTPRQRIIEISPKGITPSR